MKEKEKILFLDYIDKISNRKIVDKGWITLRTNVDNLENIKQGGITSILVPNSYVSKLFDSYHWDVHDPENCGNPGFIQHYKKGKEIIEYYRYNECEIEPIILSRNFNNIKPFYLELSEEFRLFFNLYEKYKNETDKTYIYINDNGDEEEAVCIRGHVVKAKIKFIKEYISARNMNLVTLYDLMRFSEKTMDELDVKSIDETKTNKKTFIYNHMIRDISDMKIRKDKTQSWITAKVLIDQIENYKPNVYGPFSEKKYEDFIIGVDNNGDNICFTCDPQKNDNFFGKNPGAPSFLTPVYFDKKVLKKYYDDNLKYKVKDSLIECSALWSLKIDNNHSDYVVVFLKDLGTLHYNEQLYWKSFNIQPGGGLSYTAYQRSILGKFADPVSADLYFKRKFNSFNSKWFKKYGWDLFKPLSKEDMHHLDSLHIIVDNNQQEFDKQIQSLVKIIIDSLNEKELVKNSVTKRAEMKGIDKFEQFLLDKSYNYPTMIEFMRCLQTLRSTSVAHRKSSTKKDFTNVKTYFGIGKKRLESVLDDIIEKVIMIFNTLEEQFLK